MGTSPPRVEMRPAIARCTIRDLLPPFANDVSGLLRAVPVSLKKASTRFAIAWRTGSEHASQKASSEAELLSDLTSIAESALAVSRRTASHPY